nr:hypothetical protein LSAT_2X58201 [Ipomoea batatas]
MHCSEGQPHVAAWDRRNPNARAAKEATAAGTKAAASEAGPGAGAGESAAEAVWTAESATRATRRAAKRTTFIFLASISESRAKCGILRGISRRLRRERKGSKLKMVVPEERCVWLYIKKWAEEKKRRELPEVTVTPATCTLLLYRWFRLACPDCPPFDRL